MRLQLSAIVTTTEEARAFLTSVASDLANGITHGEGWSLAPTKRETAIAEGRYRGRKVSVSREEILELAKTAGPSDIARRLGMARSSVYRVLAR